MRVFRYPSGVSARERGRAHGEAFAGEIRSLAELRTYLCRVVGGFASDAAVVRMAAEHLPVLSRFDSELNDELLGIAEGAGTSAESIVILNHYTDLRDLGRTRSQASAPSAAAETIGGDGCTVVWANTEAGPVLAQTWDMHASAIPYVIALETTDADGEVSAVLLSVTGCLGMAGLSRTGVAMAINNLHSTDATVGVVWSALVRKAMAKSSAKEACDLVLSSPIGSGHHYVVADANSVYAMETSGQKRVVGFSSEQIAATADFTYVHTNHCLIETVATSSRVPAGSTTYDRLQLAEQDAKSTPIVSADDAFVRLGSEKGYPRSVCTNMATAQKPHAAATCGALSIDLRCGRMLACAGFPHLARPTEFQIETEKHL